MKWIFLVAVLAVAPASAQSIYKCRDAKGGAVYQSDPCPEAEKRWDTEPRNYTWDDHYKRKAADASIQRDRRAVQRRNEAQQPVAVGIGVGGRRASGASIPAVTTACQSARDQRDAHYKRVGNSRTFDGARAWDDYVWSACK